MPSVTLNSRHGGKRLILAANTTVAAYHTTIPIPLCTKLTMPAVINPYKKGAVDGDVINSLAIQLFGVGNAAQAPKCLVVGWAQVGEGIDLYAPSVLAEITGTMGALTGAVGALAGTQRFCDVLALTAGVGLEGTSSINRITQLDGIVDTATIILDGMDFQFYSLLLQKGTATSANGSYSAF